jgi:hypothetical protein
VPATLDAFALVPKNKVLKVLFSSLPSFVGSLGFAIGGVCELVHNRVCRGGATCREPVWWASILGYIGGVLFLIGSFPGLFLPLWKSKAQELLVKWSFFIGSLVFVPQSVFLLIMWESNDFGLTLLSQLNHVVKQEGVATLAQRGERIGIQRPASPQKREHEEKEENGLDVQENTMSARTAIMLCVYCWIVSMATIHCSVIILRWAHRVDPAIEVWAMLDGILGQVFTIFVVFLVLVMHSAAARIPKIQPYKCVFIGFRFIFVFSALIETFAVIRWFTYPVYEVRLPGEPAFPGELVNCSLADRTLPLLQNPLEHMLVSNMSQMSDLFP